MLASAAARICTWSATQLPSTSDRHGTMWASSPSIIVWYITFWGIFAFVGRPEAVPYVGLNRKYLAYGMSGTPSPTGVGCRITFSLWGDVGIVLACRRIISAGICAWSLTVLASTAPLVSQDKLDLFHFVKYHYVAALTATGRCGHKRSAGVVFCASRISRTRHVRLTMSPTHNCVVYSFWGIFAFVGRPEAVPYAQLIQLQESTLGV